MTHQATNVLDRGTEAPPAQAPTETARGPTGVIDTRIPGELAQIGIQEIDAFATDEIERAADIRAVFIVSLTLLALFVVIFVSYLVLDAAHLLP